MFSPRTSFSRTPTSSSKGPRSYGSNRVSSSFFSPSSRSGLVSASPRNQSLNRSHASIIDETQHHAIMLYGSFMPVLVTEAIATAERITDISVRLEESGWASLVCGRRLFIWKYKDSGTWNPGLYCRELTLPPSDLAHKAELVHIFVDADTQVMSALVVSPEGIVRFWPNIAHEATSVEAATDLQGQECHSLTKVHPLNFILATTTGTLILITISVTDGQHNVICRTLKAPQGVLAGIGRKVSSFIFGGMPTQISESKILNKVLSVTVDKEDQHYVYVLSSCFFQKWHLSKDEPDRLVFEHDLERAIKEHFHQSLWVESDPAQLHLIKSWCLDMQPMQNDVLMLVAAMNLNSSHFIHYAFASFNPSESATGLYLSFSVLKHCEVYQADSEEKLLSYKFLYQPNFHVACVYSMNKVFLVTVSDMAMENDIIDISCCGSILGAGMCEGLPLFFAQSTGVLAVQFNANAFLDTNVQASPPERSILIKEPREDESSDSLISKLRSAMSLHFNGDIEKCQELVSNMFPDSSFQRANSELDKGVLLLSDQIIDDYPFSDPRWCESVPSGDSVSSSLIILHQLDDKLKAHGYVINFLKAHGLFDKLSVAKVQDTIKSTKMALCEQEEKLVAAKMLRQCFVDYNDVLEEVIKESLDARNVELKNRLTHQDMFFREVSAIDALFPTLIEWEERKLTENLEDAIKIVTIVNNILISVLRAVLQYRQTKRNVYNVIDNNLKVVFQPWTSSEGPHGLRTILARQLSINIQYTMKARDDTQIQGTAYQQVMDLVDILLEGYTSQLKSLEGSQDYLILDEHFSKERNGALRSLLDVGQFERVASLAEKYLDFDILVQLCEETQNKERLQRYVLQFKEHGFSNFMYEWYLNKGMRNKLLVEPIGQKDDLSHFLRGHDTLSWLHDIDNRQYASAQQTLRELALKENDYLSKKKTLCSLSKLAALCSDLPSEVKNNQVDALNIELDLIAHQENLPETVVEAFGLDPDKMRVLSPEELIEMYICDENTAANCYDFKIALELLQFTKKPPGDSEYESLRRHVWSKAILRDNWDELDTDNPLEAIKNTVFFQVIELAFNQDVDLHEFIIPVDDLLQAPELNDVSDCANFSFLIRAGYEYVLKLIE